MTPTAQLNSGPFTRLSTARVSVFVTPGANPTSTGLRVVLNLTPPDAHGAENLRAHHGWTDVKVEILENGRQYLPEERPDEVAELIERHATNR